MATQTVRTVVAWNPSPDQVDGYGIKVIVNGRERHVEQLPPTQLTYEIVSEIRGDKPEERDNVVLMVAPFIKLTSGEIVWGLARPLNYNTQPSRGPSPVTEVGILSVQASLPVIPASEESPKVMPQVMIVGVHQILEGTVVPIKGHDDAGTVITVSIPRESLSEAGKKQYPDGDSVPMVLSPGDNLAQYTVINPDNTTMSLEQYLHNVSKHATAPVAS